MEKTIDRLLALRVLDVMTRDPVVVSANESIDEVAARFRVQDVSAVPVVDEQGQCIGILSSTDFVKREQQPRPGESSPATAAGCMTQAVQSIEPGASLLAAARLMCDNHIHRLPVLDQKVPVGVISTMDIVAALVNAVDEMKASFKTSS